MLNTVWAGGYGDSPHDTFPEAKMPERKKCPGASASYVVAGGSTTATSASLLASQVLLQTSPYHVDSLLQLSDACRFQDDQEMARDLVGESCSHWPCCSTHVLSHECLRGCGMMPFDKMTGYKWVSQDIVKIIALLSVGVVQSRTS